MFTTKTLQFNIVQFRHLSLKRRRPMVHLSSAPNQKFRGKAIGNSHPIRPHEITKRQEVPSEIKKPSYAANGKIPKVEPRLALHNSESIGKIKKSCHLAAEILDLACCMAKEGVTTNEIDEIVHEAIVNRGGYPSTLNYNGFPKSICLSVNEVACHGIPDMRSLRGGGVYI
jgi:methionyl aminopeptidase